jgi:hypothetical protein
MTLTVTHPFVSALADGPDTSLVRPSNWNAGHTVTGTVDAANGGTGGVNNLTASSDPTVNNDSGSGYVVGSLWFNASRGVMWVARAVTVGAAVWIRQDLQPHPGYVSGNWVAAGLVTLAAATNTMLANSVCYFPFIPPETVTLDSTGGIGVRVTSTTAGQFLIGIFASDATTKRPSGTPLAYTTASIDTTATGVKTAALNANVTLEAGKLYWFGYLPDVTGASCICAGASYTLISFLMGTTTLADAPTSATNASFILQEARSYASGISAFSATPASQTITTGGVRSPLPWFKVA